MVRSSVDLVKPKNLLKTLKDNGDLTAYICDKLKDLPNIYDNRCNPDLILYICNCIENNINKSSISDKKIDKKALFFQILFKLIPVITDSEKAIIEQILEHLHNENKIKKVGILRYSYNYAKSFFLLEI